MEILTQAEYLKTITERWLNQYPENYVFQSGNSSGEVYNSLLNLKPLTKNGIDKIIGNNGWTELRCDECKNIVRYLVCFSEQAICKKCLNKALELFM